MSDKHETRAFLLGSVDYRDADRIVTLYTEALGKFSALARGAKRSRRRFGGSLQTFGLLRVRYSPGHGQLGTLHESELLSAHSGIMQSLQRMEWAGVVLRLVKDLSIERAADPEIFQSVETILSRIDQGQTHATDILMFLARLMAHCGVAPELERCARCGTRAPEGKSVTLDTSAGSVICRNCGGGAYVLAWPARQAMRSALVDENSTAQVLPDTTLVQMSSFLQGLAAIHLHKDIRPQLQSIIHVTA